MKRLFSFICMVIMILVANASITIKNVGGWFESGYVTWSAYAGASDYNVYVAASGSGNWTKLDKELVRKYPDF